MESSSSRESSPAYSTTSTEEQHSEPDSSHLAALEKLLQASLGSQLAQYTANADPEPLETINSSPATYEELSAPPEPLVVEEQPLEDEVVAFRLFSTQKVPQKIVIRETEIWPVVADPRIRDVEDEPSEIVEERERRIQSVVISGDLVQLQSNLTTSTRLLNVTTMTTIAPTSLPPSLARISVATASTRKTTRSRADRRKLNRKPRQYPRYPIPSFPQSIALHPLLKTEVPLTPQEAAEKKKREKKESIARIQFEQDERGRKNREEKERRRLESEAEALARAEGGGETAKKKKKKRKADAMEGDVSMEQSGVADASVGGGGKVTKRGAAAKARRTAQRLALRQEKGEDIPSIDV